MNKGDAGKTKKQLIAELDELREKMVQLVSLSELETIFKILPDTYFRMDEQGTILDFKAGRFSDLLDKPEHFLGRRIGEILPTDAAEKIMKALEEARKIQSLNVVEYSLPMPGGPQYYEARLLPFEHHQFLSVIRNITERKKAEEELKAAKEVAESASRLKSRFLANNGQEAVEQAVKHHPDLILMDVQMPVMGGNEAIREYINKSLAVGADAYITKPIDFERFFSQISPFLKEKKGVPKFEPIITTANRENKKEVTCIKKSISNRVREVFLKDAQTNLTMLTGALETGNFKKSKKEIKVIAHNYRGNAAEQLEQALNNEEADETLTALTQNMTDILKQIIKINSTEN